MAKNNPKVKKGHYKLRVLSQGFQKMGKGNTGSDSFSVQVETVALIDALGRETPVDPVTDYISIALTEKTMTPDGPGTQALQALGMYGDLADYDPQKEGFRSLKGVLIQGFYDLNKSQYWQWRIGKPPGTKNDSGVARSVSNRFSLPSKPVVQVQVQESAAHQASNGPSTTTQVSGNAGPPADQPPVESPPFGDDVPESDQLEF